MTPHPPQSRSPRIPALLALFLAFFLPLLAQDKKTFNLPAGPASDSLKAFATQSGLDVVFVSSATEGITTPEVRGELTPQEAIDRLLSGTPLVATTNGRSGGIKVRRETEAERKNVSRAIAEASDRPNLRTEVNESGEKVVQMDTFEVFAGRTLNMDIRRTRDDVQPYVVFEGVDISNTGALDLQEFFYTRLPMNAQKMNSQFTLNGGGATSGNQFDTINLRGLGSAQTLVLVDGRRTAGISRNSQTISQPLIKGIPLSMIDRVEVLPSTASGIYGGGATGGVINIVLKRNYAGFDLEALYGNTFESDVGRMSVNLGGGFTLETGRTRVMLSASLTRQSELLNADRPFAQDAADHLLRNNPATASLNSFYGSTANVRSSTGADLVLKPEFGGAGLGSRFTFVPLGYGGPQSDNAAALRANAGRINANGRSERLTSAPTSQAASLSVRREFSKYVDAYIDASRDRVDQTELSSIFTSVGVLATSPANPFQQNITVNLPFPSVRLESSDRIQNTRVIAGVVIKLPRDWMASFENSWSRSENIFKSLTVGSVRTTAAAFLEAHALSDLSGVHTMEGQNYFSFVDRTNADGSRNTLQNLSLRSGGPVFQLPAGPATLSVLAEEQRNRLDGSISVQSTDAGPASYTWAPPSAQDIRSYYAEAHIPIWSDKRPLRFVKEFEVIGSVRRDEYESRYAAGTFPIPSLTGPFPAVTYGEGASTATSRTIGAALRPIDSFKVRISAGTGFLPPNLNQITTRITPTFQSTSFPPPVVDPRRGGLPIRSDGVPRTVALLGTGSPNLRPELSDSLSFGAIYSPKAVDGLRIAIDVTKIKKRDEITVPDMQYIIDNETLYPDRVVRGPNVPSDLPGWAGPIVQLDTTPINVLRTSLYAIDVSLEYSRKLSHGKIRGYAIATHVDHYMNQALPTTPLVDSAGYNGGFGVNGSPLRNRGNVGIDWQWGDWAAGWNAQYYDDYYVYGATTSAGQRAGILLDQGSDTVPRQIYHDFYVRYRMANGANRFQKVIAGTEITIGIQNAFDRHPPVVTSGVSPYGDPRLRRYTLSVRKHLGR